MKQLDPNDPIIDVLKQAPTGPGRRVSVETIAARLNSVLAPPPAASSRAFMGIQPGDRVRFRLFVAGTPSETVASVNRLLIFDEHVVVNYGPFGKVVNALNYISHKSSREKRE